MGWAVGAYAIYATTDGTHWAKQYATTEQFVGVDFVSATTGWAVGVRSLLGTQDGGRSWRALGEPAVPLRSVHFVNPTVGWGIAGGANPLMLHGVLVPGDGALLVVTRDGGLSWTPLHGPENPQAVCFSEPAQGWVATARGIYRYSYTELSQEWSLSLNRPAQEVTEGLASVIECAAPHALWAMFVGGGAAAGHVPYIAYATVDGVNWRAVLEESMTMGQAVPNVPAGPDSHPGSFSVIDPSDAVFVGDGPATMVAQCVIASSGGASLRRTGKIDNAAETFAAAFVSVTTGWVLTRNAGGDYVIDATGDGGYHWSQQLAVAPSSAG